MKKRKKKKIKTTVKKAVDASRIKAYDYRSWDKFDVVRNPRVCVRL
jgi:hypothetical protein